MARGKGVLIRMEELGKVMGDVRRIMLVEVVKSNVLCLLERLDFCGLLAKEAVKTQSHRLFERLT